MRILVVGGERRLVALLNHMRWDEHSVDVARDHATARALASRGGYDLIVLDPLLPGFDVLEACCRMRGDGVAAPILMLGVLNTVEECVAALNAGADDYLVEPVSVEELRARLIALQRRLRHRSEASPPAPTASSLPTGRHI